MHAGTPAYSTDVKMARKKKERKKETRFCMKIQFMLRKSAFDAKFLTVKPSAQYSSVPL